MASRSIVSKRKRVELPYGVYAVSVASTALAGVSASHVFNWTSIFDPDVTGTGHQPLGHDQWSAFYHHYQVISATAEIIATGDNLNHAHIFTCGTYAGLTPVTIGHTVVENPGSSTKVVVGGQGGKSSQTTVIRFNAKQWFGVKDILEYDTTRASFGSNPAENAYLHVNLTPTRSVADASTHLTIRIRYTVMLSEPVALASS